MCFGQQLNDASIEFSGNLPHAVNLRGRTVGHYKEVQYRWIVGSADFGLVKPTTAFEIAGLMRDVEIDIEIDTHEGISLVCILSGATVF